MLSLLVVLTVILGVILLGSYRGIVSDADRILDLLAEGEGTFPTLPADFNWEEEGPRRRSPELGYEIRYFSVLLDESGNVATTDLGQIAAVDQETAEAYAQQVRAQGHTRGFSPGLPVFDRPGGGSDPGHFLGLQRLPVHFPIHAVYRALGVGGGAAGSVSPVAPPLPGGSSAPFWRATKSRSGSSPTPVTS